MSSLFAVLLLAATPVPPGQPVRGGHEVSASLGTLTYGGFFRAGPGVWAVEFGYHRGLFSPIPEEAAVRVGGGVRLGIPNIAGPVSGLFFPAEVFAQLQLRGRIWIFEPVVGPELGFSGLTAIGWNRQGLPDDVYQLEQQRISPFYVGVTLAPFRLRWSRVSLSLFELSLGTTVAPLGASSRTRLTYLTLGAIL